MRELTLWSVGELCGVELPPVGKRGFCPFRQHKRRDKTLRVLLGKDGDPIYRCYSCDPPFAAGDAVNLYAGLQALDRRSAWRQLGELGFAMPGARGAFRHRRSAPPPRKVPVRGAQPSGEVLPLDLGRWRSWRKQDTGALRALASERALDAALLQSHDVVDVADDAVGFGYREPASGLPCRVKVRTVADKRFWVEPKSEGRAKPLAPLYLAHDLKPPRGLTTAAIITEGELDALSLRQLGLRNSCSLPDGARSAERVDVGPIGVTRFRLWLVATDADEEGDAAYRALRARGWALGIAVGRVRWQQGAGEHPDANAALMAGWQRQDMVRCLERAAEEAMGYAVNVCGE